MKKLHWDREDIYLSCCLVSDNVLGGKCKYLRESIRLLRQVHSNTSLLSQPQTIYNLENYWARRAFSAVFLTLNAFLPWRYPGCSWTYTNLQLSVARNSTALLQALGGTNYFQVFQNFLHSNFNLEQFSSCTRGGDHCRPFLSMSFLF